MKSKFRLQPLSIILATTLVGSLLLTGCSSDSKAQAPGSAPQASKPDVTTSSVTSSTPAISLPVMPEKAKEKTDEGALAFIKYYGQLMNYANKTFDVTELERKTNPQICVECNSFIATIRTNKDRIKSEGGEIEFKDFVISRPMSPTDPRTSFTYLMTQAAEKDVDMKTGAVLAERPAESVRMKVIVQYSTNGWEMMIYNGKVNL